MSGDAHKTVVTEREGEKLNLDGDMKGMRGDDNHTHHPTYTHAHQSTEMRGFGSHHNQSK